MVWCVAVLVVTDRASDKSSMNDLLLRCERPIDDRGLEPHDEVQLAVRLGLCRVIVSCVQKR